MNKYDAYAIEMQKKDEIRKQERLMREEEQKIAGFKNVKLEQKFEGDDTLYGTTTSGKQAKFIRCWGMTKQSRYAGSLRVQQENEVWETIFTKGYQSKALAWMAKN
jgi:hypothetical protein